MLPACCSSRLWPSSSRAQTPADEPTSISTTYDAGEDDIATPKRKLVKWNEYDGPISTFRFGFGFLVDGALYSQDDESEQQVGEIEDDDGVRDSRLLFRGKFKTERPLSWTIGYMYDSVDGSWRFRQTGFQIGFPEAQGNLFIGRTKEGYSMVKIMTGYHPWTKERQPGLDAFVPILADGLKWMGYFPERRVFFSLGLVRRRAVGGRDVLHLRPSGRHAHRLAPDRLGGPTRRCSTSRSWAATAIPTKAAFDSARNRKTTCPPSSSRPRSSKPIKASTRGVEIYYREGSWLFGGEYNWQTVDATATGEELVSTAATSSPPGSSPARRVATTRAEGTSRPYHPTATVFEGGPGAWEAVLHLSYIDLDSGNFKGGKMWRLTPMVNWHLSDNIRWEFIYGYAEPRPLRLRRPHAVLPVPTATDALSLRKPRPR